MVAIASIDTASHPIQAIIHLDTGKTVRFPKVKPSGASDANDAAWQTRMQTEVVNALNQSMMVGNKNATPALSGLV